MWGVQKYLTPLLSMQPEDDKIPRKTYSGNYIKKGGSERNLYFIFSNIWEVSVLLPPWYNFNSLNLQFCLVSRYLSCLWPLELVHIQIFS